MQGVRVRRPETVWLLAAAATVDVGIGPVLLRGVVFVVLLVLLLLIKLLLPTTLVYCG